MAAADRHVVLTGFDGMQAIDIVGPAEVFDAAARLLGDRPGYRVCVATAGGATVRAASGIRIGADIALASVRRVDTLIVGGGTNVDAMASAAAVTSEVRRISAGARRTCSVCTGALFLAAAGLLDGRRATTHWAYGPVLARRFPAVRVEPDRIFVRDGDIATSAGVTAGMDLALALVEEDHGPELARSVARWMVMFLQRPGGQSQFSERLALSLAAASPLRAVIDGIVADPAGDHRQPELARRAALSERHLRRVFAEQTKTTPARFVERVRVEAARDLLESSATPVEAIARRCGFGGPETMRRAFLRVLGVGPSDYRQRFQAAA